MSKKILDTVKAYYDERLKEHGATARGVDWNSEESQYMRFEQLLKIVNRSGFSVLDYGCGYGGLLTYMRSARFAERGLRLGRYTGFDISGEMIRQAREQFGAEAKCSWTDSDSSLAAHDFVVASGIFNVKQSSSDEDWLAYMLEVLDKLNALSVYGFAFNILTAYSDPPYMRDDLFYAQPEHIFAHCQVKYSRWVSILHDYPLYEFSVLVRKNVD